MCSDKKPSLDFKSLAEKKPTRKQQTNPQHFTMKLTVELGIGTFLQLEGSCFLLTAVAGDMHSSWLFRKPEKDESGS